MINSEIYFRNFESIDKEKKSILFIAGAGMDHRLVRSLKLPDSEFNKPLIIDLPGQLNNSTSRKQFSLSLLLVISLKLWLKTTETNLDWVFIKTLFHNYPFL